MFEVNGTQKIVDSGYCNKDEWKSEKERQIKRWTKQGYTDVKCKLQRTDTVGLRMFIVTGVETNNGR